MSLKISAVFFLLILPNLGLSKIIKCSLDSYKALGNTKYGNVDNWIEGFLGVQFNINTKKNTVTTFQSKGAKGREIRISRTITNSKFTTYRYRRSVFDYSFRVYNNGLGKMNVQQNPVTKYIPVEGSGRCIEETKSNLENTNKETLINLDYDEKPPGEDKKPKSKNSSSRLMMLLILATLVAILFFFNKFQIIDLDFNKFTSSVFSLIDSFLLKIKFYYFQLQK